MSLYKRGEHIPDVTRPGAEQPELDMDVELSDGYDFAMMGRGDGSESWAPGSFVEPCNQPKDDIKRPEHYARYAIEPCTFIMANDLPFAEGNVVKYICRWRYKNGRQDLEKAKRYIEMIIEDLDRKEAGTVADCVGKPL